MYVLDVVTEVCTCQVELCSASIDNGVGILQTHR